MAKKRIFIDGAEGTTGIDIKERLAQLNDDIADGLEVITLPDELRKDKKHRGLNLNDCDLAILCLPDEAARESVAMVENPTVKILDCSTAHRVSHGWVYGLPEYNDQQATIIGKAPRVANPGCYATGFILLATPLIREGLISDDYPLAVFGLSGYSGGGKSMMAEYENADKKNKKPKKIKGHVYGLNQTHKHLMEMADYGLLSHPPLFQPVVGDFPRGMVIMIPLNIKILKKINQETIKKIWAETYGGCKKIILGGDGDDAGDRILPDAMAGTDDIKLSVAGNEAAGRLTLYATYDNLGKGASGAAIQNLKLMLGL